MHINPGRLPMKTVATTALALLVFSFPAFANVVPDILIHSGLMRFEYTKIAGPGDPISGQFLSSGTLKHDPPNEGTAAAVYALDGIHYATVVGAMVDGTDFTDGAVIVVSSATPLTEGTYDLDGTTGVLAFVDDAVDWHPPTDLWKTNWTLELLLLDAAGKYGSTSGTVTFGSITGAVIWGVFEATVADPETGTVLSITNGYFDVEPPVGTDPSSWSSIKALYR
jgi:hypothetical protein